MRAYLGRRYRLSAAHRLHTESLSEAENLRVYGKCANPHGHGHNYTVEVVVGGEMDPVTGMVTDLVALDACVGRMVVEPFDRQNLNTLECFRGAVPTTENFCLEIERRLREALPEKLSLAVRVEETGNNSFETVGNRE
ncbi:MAG TPA: 6-carboxytetrahydropterin synthase [Acidobacteriaceae bacterium]|jgi:6-pyruvoyltetrahydropterin/6-carboxytetrahydropterin synthase|nr:6-carboxytetrahydropterin synthase [Acidobacteriaceae bacterium]